jgi:hypothetical protein
MPKLPYINTEKWIAYAVSACILFFNITHAKQATAMVPIVDGWAVLNRIMHFKLGEISWDQYLLGPHGAHLHSVVYFVALLDFNFAGGQQKIMQAISLSATVLFCFFIIRILIRQGLEIGKNPFLLSLVAAATAAVLSNIIDYETLLHPFQVVLSLARLTYIVLLWALIKGVIERNIPLYIATIIFSIVAVSFHGSGHIFAICVILTHLLAWRNGWWLAASTTPLLSVLLLQSYYSPEGGELSQIYNVVNIHSLSLFFPAVFAYFASPLRLFLPIIGDPATLLIGFVLLCSTVGLTTITIINILNLRSWLQRILWKKPRAPETRRQPEGEMIFFAIVGMFVLISAVAAALFWIIRTKDGTFDEAPYRYVLGSARYGSFASLSYVMIMAACLRATITGKKGSPFRFPDGLSETVTLVLLTSALWSSYRVIQIYDFDDQLNYAAAGISIGLSPIQPEAEVVWPGAKGDWYWKTELPKTVAYLRAVGKGVWHSLPEIGAKGEIFDTTHIISNVDRLPVVSDKNLGRCAFTGKISSKDFNFSKMSLLLPVVTSDGIVNGYAVLTRQSSDQSERLIKGFVLCPLGYREDVTLFLAPAMKVPQNMHFDVQAFGRSVGERAISPLSDMKGEFHCALESESAALSDILVITIRNLSAFDWRFGEGRFPLRIGVHFLKLDGTLLLDEGFRFPDDPVIMRNSSITIRFPLAELSLKRIAEDQREVIANIGLVQDGYAWFEPLNCKVMIRRIAGSRGVQFKQL